MPKNSEEIAHFIVDTALVAGITICGAVLVFVAVFGYLKSRG